LITPIFSPIPRLFLRFHLFAAIAIDDAAEMLPFTFSLRHLFDAIAA